MLIPFSYKRSFVIIFNGSMCIISPHFALLQISFEFRVFHYVFQYYFTANLFYLTTYFILFYYIFDLSAYYVFILQCIVFYFTNFHSILNVFYFILFTHHVRIYFTVFIYSFILLLRIRLRISFYYVFHFISLRCTYFSFFPKYLI